MKATLLIFLYLLTVAETTGKPISPEGRLPRDYLEEENEGGDDDDYDDDDNDDNTPNVEQSPEPERISVSQTDDGVGVLEKSMEKLQEKAQVTSPEEEEEESSQEEQALESRLGPHYLTHSGQSHSEELPLHVSHMADLPERNTARENNEYCKVHVVLVTSRFFLVHTEKWSCDTSVSYFDLLKGVPDSSVT
ncbi:PREDICTED: zinc finger and BTB domain-containing protein 47-like [Calidris pugnax]|uniref:zinc finger and BTB domain-containing protein 47-like n=1 Tax=Calidris pugnax TaxID=198806 RepID=UPI00071E0292|nr:PREDICTED: zinc finger and BTB domain-containing protein 47-like [Calidris pugnax]